VHLLLLTGRSDPQDIILGLEAGADDFLRKPFNPSELMARLEVGHRAVQLHNALARNVAELKVALVERNRTEERLRHSELRLRMVMDAVPAGVLVCDGQTGVVNDSNHVAQRCLGLPAGALAGETYHRFFRDVQGGVLAGLPAGAAGADCRLVSAAGQASHIRLSQASLRWEDRDLRLLSFLDISDTRRLLAEQQLNLDQARKLLTIANGGVPRWIGVNEELTLHLAHYSASSQRAGGDHCWARSLPARGSRGPVTLVGLRDQSGHEVNCILRSIATDLLHQEILQEGRSLADQLGVLNARLCASGMFADDDFLTGLTLELDHASLRLDYVSCGHPPLFLIRRDQIIELPDASGAGRNLPLGALGDASFTAGRCQLLAGDRLVLFTDGLGELGRSARGTVLGVAEIRRILLGLVQDSPGLPIRELVRRLLDAVSGEPGGWTAAPPPDDVTVLGLELEPDAGDHELVFQPAGLPALDQAVEQTHRRLLAEWRLPPDSSRRIRLLLDEALTNAWRHGNRASPRLPIRVRWGRHNGLSVVVEDAGRGFDPAHLPDPRSPAGLLEEAGRGVYLIRNSCEWVAWKKGGARLVARLPHAAPAPANSAGMPAPATPKHGGPD